MGKKTRNRSPKRKTATPQSAQSLSPARLWTFRIVLVTFPLLFLLLLEGGLRLFHYGYSNEVLIPNPDLPGYLMVNPDLGRRYFPSGKVHPHYSQDFIAEKKPEGGIRIFVLGGSSALGYPYFFNGSFSTMLRILLEETYPNTPIEVMNLALNAVNSYAVLDIGRRLWKYQPDLILVYSGHNEFYGGLGVGSMEKIGGSRRLVKIYLALTRLRSFQLLQNAIHWIQAKIHPTQPPAGTLMERVVKEQEIGYGSSLYRTAHRIFQENMEELLKDAQQHGVKVILGTLVSNVHDLPPFRDKFSGDRPSPKWREIFAGGKEALQANDYPAAVEAFSRCLALDSLPASPYFYLARAQEKLGNIREAYQNYYLAKDHDALRFRASEDLNRIIVALSRRFSLPYARVKLFFERYSPDQIPGNNLILEHLHPNLQGYYLIAQAYYKAIQKIKLFRQPPRWPPPDEVLWKKFGITDFDREIGKLRILILTNSWPFKPNHVSSLQALHYQPRNLVEELAQAYWENRITWEQAHVKLAEYYTAQKDYSKAEAEYRALIAATPYNPSPYRRLAYLLITQQKFAPAKEVLLELLQISPDFFTHKWLGALLLNEGKVKESIFHLQKALELNSRDPQVLYNLTGAYMLAQNFQQAYRTGLVLKKLNPNFPGFARLWQHVESKYSQEKK